MLWPGIRKLGKELGFKRTNSEIVGKLKNCFIKIFDGNNMKVLEIFKSEMDEQDKEYIINILKQKKVKKYEWITNGVRIIFSEYIRPYSIVKIKEILFILIDYLEQKYYDIIPICHRCSIEKEADVYFIGNISKYLCYDCFKTYEKELNNEYCQYKQLPTNYFSGFIGALLFSFIGIMVTVLLFVFFQRLAAICGLLYIILGIKGYKVFKGKMTPIGALIIISVGLIMISVGTFFAYSVMILMELKTTDINILKTILNIPEVKNELKLNIILSYVISGFFIILQLFTMLKDWKFQKNILKARDI